MTYMAKVFVAGGRGYIGSCLCSSGFSERKTLLVGRADYNVFLDLNISDFSSVLMRVEAGDFFILLSAISSPDACAKSTELAWRVNVTNTITLIEELITRGVRVVFASSDVVFGKHSGISYENSHLQPAGIYGDMKAEVEKAVSGNPLVKVVRFSLVLGKGDKFSEMLKVSASLGKKVSVFAGFERNIVSIDDVTEGIMRLVVSWDDFPEQLYNFSGPHLVSREEMTAALAQVIPGLLYTVTEAPEGFWVNRERVIETDCKNFTRLLGRKPKNLEQIISGWVN